MIIETNTFFMVCTLKQIHHVHAYAGIREIKPFVIGIWSGKGKPNDLDEFLTPFVDDLNDITCNGIVINGFRLDVVCNCCVCDSPARSLLKGGYFF